jgi:hypothetical protein
MAKESDMTENQIATLTRLSMILEAGQAENGIDLARQATYAEALRALLARQPAAIDKQEAVAYRDFGRLAQYFDDIGDPHGANVIRTYRDNLYAAPLANEASKPAPSVEQDERGALNADVRAFLENLAEAGSEPLNSVAAYRDKESRLHFMVEVRNGARALLACAASTSANVAQGWKLVPIEPTTAMVDALWDGLPKGFAFSNCTPTGVVASIIAAAPAQSSNVAQDAEACELCKGVGQIGIPGQRCFACDGSGKSKFAAMAAAQSASGDKS